MAFFPSLSHLPSRLPAALISAPFPANIPPQATADIIRSPAPTHLPSLHVNTYPDQRVCVKWEEMMACEGARGDKIQYTCNRFSTWWTHGGVFTACLKQTFIGDIKSMSMWPYGWSLRREFQPLLVYKQFFKCQIHAVPTYPAWPCCSIRIFFSNELPDKIWSNNNNNN